MKLSDLKIPTQNLTITSINGSESVRLLEMGLTPGTSFSIVRTAPLGYPIEIKIRGYLLTLRKLEADCISIRQN